MPRGVDEVEDVRLPVIGGVLYPGGVELDRDAPLPLQVHAVQQLLLHISLRHRVAVLKQPVSGESRSIGDAVIFGQGEAAGQRAWICTDLDPEAAMFLVLRLMRLNSRMVRGGPLENRRRGVLNAFVRNQAVDNPDGVYGGVAGGWWRRLEIA